MRGSIVVMAAAVLLLAACGGGGPRLSQSEYRARLVQIKQEAGSAQSAVALGLQAESVARLRGRLDAFADSTERIGDEVAKLNPPENAEAANTELADGLHDTADATREASKAIADMHTVREGISYLQHSRGNEKGAREVNHALARLRQLGYITSS